MAETVIWIERNLSAAISELLFDTKSISNVPKKLEENTPLIVPLSLAEGGYAFYLDSSVLQKYPHVNFADATTGELVATLNESNKHTQLTVLQAKHSMDLKCDFQNNQLSILSPGNVLLSGNIQAEKLHVECDFFNIQNNEFRGIQNYSSIAANEIIIRSNAGIKIDDLVKLSASDSLCLIGKQINNNASNIETNNFVLATEDFLNSGRIKLITLTGFTQKFQNKSQGQLIASHHFSISTEIFANEGKINTHDFDVLAHEMNLRGYLTTDGKCSAIIRDQINIENIAIIKPSGIFDVQCKGDINFAGQLEQNLSERNQVTITAEGSLNFSGCMGVNHAQVKLNSAKNFHLTGTVYADHQSTLAINSNEADISGGLLNFSAIAMVANQLKIRKSLLVDHLFLAKAQQLDIEQLVKSKGFLDIHVITLNIIEDAILSASKSSKLECDTLANYGNIITEQSLTAGINYFIYNRGNVSAEVINIDAGIYANFGAISSKKFCEINSLVLLSAGITSAGDFKSNALFEFNAGLHVTSLPELDEILSITTVKKAATLFARNFLPKIHQGVNLALESCQWLKPLFTQRPSENYQAFIKTCSGALAKMKSFSKSIQSDAMPPLHAIIREIAKIKSHTEYANQKYKQLKSLDELQSEISKELGELFALRDSDSIQQFVRGKNNAFTIGIVESLLSSYSADSLLSIEASAKIIGSTSVNNFKMHNHAFYAALGSLSIQSNAMSNQGNLVSFGKLSLQGISSNSNFKDLGRVMSFSEVEVEFGSVELDSEYVMTKRNWHVNADNCSLGNKQNFAQSVLNAKQIVCKSNSGLTLKNSQIHADEKFVQQKKSHLEIEDQSIVDAQDVILKSTLSIKNSIVIASNNVEQSDNLTGKNATIQGASVKINKANLENGSILAEDLHLSHTTTNDTLIQTRTMAVHNSKIIGKATLVRESLQAQNTLFENVFFSASQANLSHVTLSKCQAVFEGQLRTDNLILNQTYLISKDPDLKEKTTIDASGTIIGKIDTDNKVKNAAGEIIGQMMNHPKYGLLAFDHEGKLLGKIHNDSEDAPLKSTFIPEAIAQVAIPTIGVALGLGLLPMLFALPLGNYFRKRDNAEKIKNERANVQAASIIESSNLLKIEGDFTGSNAILSGQNVEINSSLDLKKSLAIFAENKLHTSKKSKIAAESLFMKAHDAELEGDIQTSQAFGLATYNAHNYGNIHNSGKTQALFDVKYIFANLGGAISGKNTEFRCGVFANLGGGVFSDKLTINTGVFANIAGVMVGQDSFQVNSLAAINVGFMQSANMRMASVFSLNFGLFLPSLPKNPQDILTLDMALNVGKTFCYNFLPAVSSGIGIVKGAYNILSTGNNAYEKTCDTMVKIWDIAKTDPLAINVGEFVSMLASIKDVADTCSATYSELPDWDPRSYSGRKFVFTETINDCASQVASSFIPSFSSSTIYQSNYGMIDTGNITEQSMWSYNSGIKTAHRCYTSQFYYSRNNGVIGASNMTFSGNAFDNEGTLSGSQKLNMNLNTFKQTNGEITGSHSNIQIHHAEISGGKAEFNQNSEIKIGTLISDDCGQINLDNSTMEVTSQTEVKKDSEIKLMNGSTLKTESSAVDGRLVAESNSTIISTQKPQISEQGSVQLQESTFSSESIANKGTITAKQGSKINIDKEYESSAGSTTNLDQSTLNANEVKLEGNASFKESSVAVNESFKLNDAAKVRVERSKIAAKNADLNGDIFVTDQAIFQADGLFQSESSHIDGDQGTIILIAKTGDVQGHITSKSAEIHIDELPSVNDLISGINAHQNIQPKENLQVSTQQDVDVTKKVSRECGVDLSAKSISVNASVDTRQNLHLNSTEGDIIFSQKVHADGAMQIDSGNKVTNDGQSITSNKNLSVTAKNEFGNLDGQFKSNARLSIDAASIKNQKTTVDSSAELRGQETHLLARESNIENLGGTIQGSEQLHATAQGDIKNVCFQHAEQGTYDTIPRFVSAQILAGFGENNNNVGLSLVAEGKVTNDGSVISSHADNHITTKKGFESRARSETYVALNEKKSSWFGLKQEHEFATGLSSQGACVTSTGGRNIIFVQEGGVKASATGFITKGGTEITARDDIQLYGATNTTNQRVKTSYLGGLFGSDNAASHEVITPTLIYDNGKSVICSKIGNIQGKDTYIAGSGHLVTIAKNVEFSNSVLKHQEKSSSRGMDIRCFGAATVKAIAGGEFSSRTVLTEDPTLSKIYSVSDSENLITGATNIWNASLSVYSTYSTGTQSILPRYGLGDTAGFNPTVTFVATQTHGKAQNETLDPSCISRGSWDVKAENLFSLDGVPVDILGDMTIKAWSFKQSGVELNSSFKSSSQSISLGLAATGNLVDIGVSYQEMSSTNKAYTTQNLNVAGKLTVESNSWEMQNATATVENLAGHVDQLKISTQQNVAESSGFSGIASTQGQVGISVTSVSSAKTAEPSGIYVIGQPEDSQNKSVFSVGKVDLIGSTVIKNGDKIRIEFGSVNSTAAEDHEFSVSLGLSGNIIDLLPGDTATTIPVTGVDFGYQNYQATQQTKDTESDSSVIFYTHPEIYKNQGIHYFHLDVPRIKWEADSPKSESASEVINKNPKKEKAVPIGNTEQINEFADNAVITASDSNELYQEDYSSQASSEIMDIAIVAHPVRLDVQHAGKGLLQLLPTENLDIPDINFAGMNTVRCGWKPGRNGQLQLFNINDKARYTTVKKSIEQITQKSKYEKLIWDASICTEISNVDLVKNQYYLFDNTNSFFQPRLSTNLNGNLSANFNCSDLLLTFDATLGGNMRFTLAGDKYTTNWGSVSYAIDAASASADCGFSVNTDRFINAKAYAELGVLGPSANFTVSTPEFSFSGIKFQYETKLNAGVGAKGSLGAGLTFDKSQWKIRPYFELGAYCGAGAKVENQLSVAIDWDAGERIRQAYVKISENDSHRKTIEYFENLESEIYRRESTGLLDAITKYIHLILIMDAKHDQLKMPLRAARGAGFFSVSKPKLDTTKNETILVNIPIAPEDANYVDCNF